MTLDELCDQLRAAGTPLPRTTVKDVLNDEVVRPNSRLVRVRHGRYRLRDADDVPRPGSGNVAEHVVEAMQGLALKGCTRVIPQEIEAELILMRVPYSLRAVRAGLLQLQRRAQPVVERTADGRYRLSPTRRRTGP